MAQIQTQDGKLITAIIMYGSKLLIYSYETLTVQSLEFGNGLVISSHILSRMWILIHAGI